MAITKTIWGFSSPTSTKETYFAGRVLRVENVSETRNWSDTLDYSDFRTTTCTYALVWLGTHNLPPRIYNNAERPAAESDLLQAKIASYMADKVRDLEFFEQFAWVDCTGIFSDRNGFRLTCEVDAEITKGGDPLMWANFIAWEAYCKALGEKKAAEAAAREAEKQRLEAVTAAKKAARAAKAAAKDAVGKAAAEANLHLIPAKGTKVTVDGITGTLFWKGATKFRGTWSARGGVKDARGNVYWIDAEKFSQ